MTNTYQYSVIPENIDSRGQITIPRLCGTIVNAIGQNIRVEGYGIDVMARDNLSWVLLRSAFEIDTRPKLYSTMYISVWPVMGSSLSHKRCIRILDQEGQEIGRGTTEWCIIDRVTRRPVLPGLSSETNTQYQELGSIPCKAPKRIKDFDPELKSERTVCFSDCDFNGHLTNTRYVDMIYDLLPESVLNSRAAVRLDINYRREAPRGIKISTGLLCSSPEEWLFIARDDSQTLCSASLSISN